MKEQAMSQKLSNAPALLAKIDNPNIYYYQIKTLPSYSAQLN